jgi:hypothetical protein
MLFLKEGKSVKRFVYLQSYENVDWNFLSDVATFKIKNVLLCFSQTSYSIFIILIILSNHASLLLN